MGLSDGRKKFRIGLAVLIQYWSVTVTQPPAQPRCRSYYALRQSVEPENGFFHFGDRVPTPGIDWRESLPD